VGTNADLLISIQWDVSSGSLRRWNRRALLAELSKRDPLAGPKRDKGPGSPNKLAYSGFLTTPPTPPPPPQTSGRWKDDVGINASLLSGGGKKAPEAATSIRTTIRRINAFLTASRRRDATRTGRRVVIGTRTTRTRPMHTNGSTGAGAVCCADSVGDSASDGPWPAGIPPPTFVRLKMRSHVQSSLVGLAILVMATAGCGETPSAPGPSDRTRTFSYDFRRGTQGWVPGAPQFYGVNNLLAADYRPLDGGLASQGSAFFARTAFAVAPVYFKRQISGLEPDSTYSVRFSVEIATDTPSKCLSFYGALGEDTLVLVGATTTEPSTTYGPGASGFQSNFDLGQWNVDGANGFILGDVATPLPCPVRVWQLKSLQRTAPLGGVKTDASGRAWVLQATSAGSGALVGFYFTRFSATFTPE